MKPLKVIQHKHFLTNLNCSDTMYESKYEMCIRETTGINGNPNTPDTVACWVLSSIVTGSNLTGYFECIGFKGGYP